MKKVSFSKAALKQLRRIPAAKLIREKLNLYSANPQALANNVTGLKGTEGGVRLRVQDWRVLFVEDDDTISVVSIEPRGSAYD